MAPINDICNTTLQHIHTHTNVSRPFSRSTWVGRYQNYKPLGILLKQLMTGWQWHQLDHMQIMCTSLQITMPTPHHSIFFTGQLLFLPPNEQHQSTQGNKVVILVSVFSISSHQHAVNKLACFLH